jgi:hypothetical protein
MQISKLTHEYTTYKISISVIHLIFNKKEVQL